MYYFLFLFKKMLLKAAGSILPNFWEIKAAGEDGLTDKKCSDLGGACGAAW